MIWLKFCGRFVDWKVTETQYHLFIFKNQMTVYYITFENMNDLPHPYSPSHSTPPSTIPSRPLKSDSTDDELQIQNPAPRRLKTNLCKYKTEMCKNYSENGFCRYINKCQFAHGED